MSFLGVYGGEIARAVRRRVYTLAAVTGVTVTRCIGRGQNGAVFMTAGGGVLKVSAHEGEAPLAMTLAGRGRAMPFLPIFYDAWILPGPTLGLPDGWRLGVTYREDLRDFVPARPWWYMRQASKLVSAAANRRASTSLETRHARILADAKRAAVGIDMRALVALSGFLVWSEKSGLNYDEDEFDGSLARRNLGVSVKDDAVVIRDLGNLEPKRGAMGRLERGIARRRNSDEELRRHERAAATGDVQARARLLAGRLRSGTVKADHLAVAAWLGDEAAGMVVPAWDPRIGPAMSVDHPDHPARQAIIYGQIDRRVRVRLAADFAEQAIRRVVPAISLGLMDMETDAIAAARRWVASAPRSEEERSAEAASDRFWTVLANRAGDDDATLAVMAAAAAAADSTNTEEWCGRAAEWAASAGRLDRMARLEQRLHMIAVLTGDAP